LQERCDGGTQTDVIVRKAKRPQAVAGGRDEPFWISGKYHGLLSVAKPKAKILHRDIVAKANARRHSSAFITPWFGVRPLAPAASSVRNGRPPSAFFFDADLRPQKARSAQNRGRSRVFFAAPAGDGGYGSKMVSEVLANRLAGSSAGWFVARMKRSAMRDHSDAKAPDFAALHPGYEPPHKPGHDGADALISKKVERLYLPIVVPACVGTRLVARVPAKCSIVHRLWL
jgi:hypothetical protein